MGTRFFFYCSNVISEFFFGEPKPPKDWNLKAPWGIDLPDYTEGAPDIKIGIFDTGIDRNHPDLEKNMSDFFWDAVNHENPPITRDSHGTAVAGVIGAVGKNMKGIAHPVKLVDFKCVSSKEDKADPNEGINQRFVECLNQAIEQNVSILNCSFSSADPSKKVQLALKRAHRTSQLSAALSPSL